jgi:hypothetical protein
MCESGPLGGHSSTARLFENGDASINDLLGHVLVVSNIFCVATDIDIIRVYVKYMYT